MGWINPFQAFNPYGGQSIVDSLTNGNNWGNFFSAVGSDVNAIAQGGPIPDASNPSGGGSTDNGSSYVGMPTSVLPPQQTTPPADPHAGMIQLPNGQWVSSATYQAMISGGYSGGGGGGGISAYQQGLLDIEKQKEADQNSYWNNLIADAQKKNDIAAQTEERNRQNDMSTGIDTFTKNFRDYQNSNYYGGMYGPGYFAPEGAAQPYAAPEPYWVQQYYKDNPTKVDPFSAPAPYAGYQGSNFMNPSHPGMQNATPAPLGATAATSASSQPIPYGPELTGASGHGALMTNNGTPVPMSAWQARTLDPTSINHYDSYVHDIAGWNPKDLYNVTGVTQQDLTQPPSDGTMNLKAPLGFSPPAQ